MSYAPILLFVYKRADTLAQTLASLKANPLAASSDLVVYADNARKPSDQRAVDEVRALVRAVDGFRSVTVVEAPVNKGLARSIIDGVTDQVERHGRVIVLEDDLLLAPNFLDFMNLALDAYQADTRVFSISGFMFDARMPGRPADAFFTQRHCSWGWAIWKDRWDGIDWDVTDFAEFIRSPARQKAFNRLGSDLTHSLAKQMRGEINSWAIRCNYHQFKNGGYTLYPFRSKVVNLGFGEGATHTGLRFNKYKATLDSTGDRVFRLPAVALDSGLLRVFARKYSQSTRVYYHLLNRIFK
ncbi:MAG TPA: hypothetical protein VL547_05065 [Dinghuibacter sp.]|uniref:sugar transferase n=1 Tax=Dinghuibacter sp. TaxID=2024697 RepID=UPI002BCD8F71|nr:sugar transferase [Dinghuibacter sp.]HTJ11367.1 hypothetical protein [Dinghuibacter sp.]